MCGRQLILSGANGVLDLRNLDLNLRTMIESLQMKRLNHNEPAGDVLSLIEKIITEEEKAWQPQ